MVTLLSYATMQMLRLPLPISCAFALGSALDSSVGFLFLATVDRKPAHDLGSCSTGMIRSGSFRGDRRFSQLPWTPQSCFAVLLDPGRTSTPDHRGASVLPPLSRTRRLPLYQTFEAHSHGFAVCCLRLKTPSLTPTKARFRWLVRPFRAGFFPQGFDRGFLGLGSFFSLFSFLFGFVGSSTIPASQGFGWRHAFVCWGMNRRRRRKGSLCQ